MSGLTVSHRIGASPEVVFDVFTDAERYPGYTPIRRVEIERSGEGDRNGRGAIRALSVAGPSVRELVTEYERPSLFAFEVISGAPVRSYAGRLSFVPAAAGRATDVTYEVEVQPLVPGTGWATAAAFRGAIETLMRLADREAGRRSAS